MLLLLQNERKMICELHRPLTVSADRCQQVIFVAFRVGENGVMDMMLAIKVMAFMALNVLDWLNLNRKTLNL